MSGFGCAIGEGTAAAERLDEHADTFPIRVRQAYAKLPQMAASLPRQLVMTPIFDQSIFVKDAIENLIHEGATGLLLTGLMILVFLASPKATA